MSTFDIEDKLRAAAATIGCMPDAELNERLRKLKQALSHRSNLDKVRAQTELDSVELDQAAYDLARQHEADEDLPAAARWYRAAATNDFADAPLQLAKVLDALAERYLSQAPSQASLREEMDLVSEAARWYAAAFAAGHMEAAERLDSLIARHDPSRPRPPRPDLRPSGALSSSDSDVCLFGGLREVLAHCDLLDAATHFGDCPPCQEELLRGGGLLSTRRQAPKLELPAQKSRTEI